MRSRLKQIGEKLSCRGKLELSSRRPWTALTSLPLGAALALERWGFLPVSRTTMRDLTGVIMRMTWPEEASESDRTTFALALGNYKSWVMNSGKRILSCVEMYFSMIITAT